MKYIRILTAILFTSIFFVQAGDWPNPERFENQIADFEQQDQQSPPPEGAILCIGSSSMRMWNDSIAEDLAPLTVIPRGFGGSTIHDVIHFADRIVLPYKPRAILLYEGDNDSVSDNPPEEIVSHFGDFFALVHKALPETRIYIISVKPSVRRQHIWPKAQEINSGLEKLCSTDSRLTFIDASTILLNEDGTPRADILKEDMLHMKPEGYVLWKKAIHPVLMNTEAQHEQ